MSEVPDSGIGRTQDNRTRRSSVGWCNQGTFQPTIPQLIRRKRQAGDRVVMGSDVGRDVRRQRQKVGDSFSDIGQVFEAIVCSGGMESPRRGHPQRGPTGAGTPAGVTRSFGEGAIGTLWLSWEIGEL